MLISLSRLGNAARKTFNEHLITTSSTPPGLPPVLRTNLLPFSYPFTPSSRSRWQTPVLPNKHALPTPGACPSGPSPSTTAHLLRPFYLDLHSAPTPSTPTRPVLEKAGVSTRLRRVRPSRSSKLSFAALFPSSLSPDRSPRTGRPLSAKDSGVRRFWSWTSPS